MRGEFDALTLQIRFELLDAVRSERTAIAAFLPKRGFFWNYVKSGKFGIGKKTCVGSIKSPKRKAQHANGFGSELLEWIVGVEGGYVGGAV